MPPPDRWNDYRALGTVIPGTKFIAFKVPLKETMLQGLAEEERFSPKILLQRLEENGLKLGGVIDLTFTQKYYNKEEFLGRSVDYAKIYVAGHAVPSEAVFRKFAAAVRAFGKNGNLVGVHCTHGINRTGYLICRYMIEEMNVNPEKAIQLFDEARGHKVERPNYLEDLLSRKIGQSALPVSDYNEQFEWRSLPCDQQQSQSKKIRKPRWRDNREDHPEWRRNKSSYPYEGANNEDPGNHHQGNPEKGDFRNLTMGAPGGSGDGFRRSVNPPLDEYGVFRGGHHADRGNRYNSSNFVGPRPPTFWNPCEQSYTPENFPSRDYRRPYTNFDQLGSLGDYHRNFPHDPIPFGPQGRREGTNQRYMMPNFHGASPDTLRYGEGFGYQQDRRRQHYRRNQYQHEDRQNHI